MKKITSSIFLIIILFSSFLACSPSSNTKSSSHKKIELTVSAAASLKSPLNEIKENFEHKNKDVVININFASSGSLRKQIEQGAPVDLFFSANASHFDKLVSQELIDKDTRTQFAKNKICLIFNNNLKNNIKSIDELTNDSINKVSIGNPETVPAGNYAKQSLEFYHIYSTIKNKMVFAKSVKDIVSYVESGNVDVGIVYFSDTTTMKDNLSFLVVDNSSHEPIQYVCGIVSSSNEKDISKKFIDYVKSNAGKHILNQYGLIAE